MRRAVWNAMNSAHGDRLVEIAREHIKLVSESIGLRSNEVDAEIINARITALRSERDGILEMFEGDDE